MLIAGHARGRTACATLCCQPSHTTAPAHSRAWAWSNSMRHSVLPTFSQNCTASGSLLSSACEHQVSNLIFKHAIRAEKPTFSQSCTSSLVGGMVLKRMPPPLIMLGVLPLLSFSFLALALGPCCALPVSIRWWSTSHSSKHL